MTFVKGKSGNPGGKEKVLGLVKTLARQQTEPAIRALVEVMTTSEKGSERVSAAEALLNRAWGRPEQEVEVKGDLIDSIRVLVGQKDK